jgi:hypothetical protein
MVLRTVAAAVVLQTVKIKDISKIRIFETTVSHKYAAQHPRQFTGYSD